MSNVREMWVEEFEDDDPDYFGRIGVDVPVTPEHPVAGVTTNTVDIPTPTLDTDGVISISIGRGNGNGTLTDIVTRGYVDDSVDNRAIINEMDISQQEARITVLEGQVMQLMDVVRTLARNNNEAYQNTITRGIVNEI